jgi:hypothetical protein
MLLMEKLLELPQGENSLLVAYEALLEGKSTVDENNVASVYKQYFVTAVPPASVQAPVFERVSLVDPTIRTIVRSSTSAA